MGCRIDFNWVEQMRIVLPEDRPRFEMPVRDGAVVTLSPVLKADREFFEKGIEEMSVKSRFYRFGLGVGSLSQRELDYLSDVDQQAHVAWGAALGDDVAGVGRYIVAMDGSSAEVAVTVLDDMQRRGVGTALLTALVAVARADGISEFTFEARFDNPAVVRMLGDIEVTPIASDGLIERRIRLTDLPVSEHEPRLVAVMGETRG